MRGLLLPTSLALLLAMPLLWRASDSVDLPTPGVEDADEANWQRVSVVPAEPVSATDDTGIEVERPDDDVRAETVAHEVEGAR